MTKPTVKGGLAPADAVVCEGKEMRDASVATLRGKPGVGTPHHAARRYPHTIRGDQLAFRVATDAACDGEQGIGQLTSG